MAWRNATGCRFAERFVDAVGVSRGTAQGYYRAAKDGRDVPISKSIALAMAAVAAGLRPWGEQPEDGKDE